MSRERFSFQGSMFPKRSALTILGGILPMRSLVVSIATVIALSVSAASFAEPISGQVEEIIIKVKTADGEKWYRLGKDLTPMDIKAGDRIRFDYADDTVEEIPVEPSDDSTEGQDKSQ